MERHYNILDEVRAFVDGKPESVSDPLWETASPRIRNILIEIGELLKSLDDACLEAARNRQWNRALVIVEYLKLNPELYAPQLSGSLEEEFLAYAREWLSHVEDVLGIPHSHSSP